MEIILRLALIGLLFWFLFSLIILVKAFQDSIVQFLLCLVVPFYILYYMFFRMQSERRGLLVGGWLLFTFTGPLLNLIGPSFVKHEACKLLDAAEVEAVLGQRVQPLVSTSRLTPFGMIDACVCRTVSSPQKEVMLALERKCDSLQSVREEASGELMAVSGLGEEAYWGGSALVARKGRSCIYLEVNDESGMDRMTKFRVATSLAQTAFQRVPR